MGGQRLLEGDEADTEDPVPIDGEAGATSVRARLLIRQPGDDLRLLAIEAGIS
jgi:hypothetical protein